MELIWLCIRKILMLKAKERKRNNIHTLLIHIYEKALKKWKPQIKISVEECEARRYGWPATKKFLLHRWFGYFFHLYRMCRQNKKCYKCKILNFKWETIPWKKQQTKDRHSAIIITYPKYLNKYKLQIKLYYQHSNTDHFNIHWS